MCVNFVVSCYAGALLAEAKTAPLLPKEVSFSFSKAKEVPFPFPLAREVLLTFSKAQEQIKKSWASPSWEKDKFFWEDKVWTYTTVKLPNKGCFGDNINSDVVSFVERFSEVQNVLNYTESSYVGHWKSPLCRGMLFYVPIWEGPLLEVLL